MLFLRSLLFQVWFVALTLLLGIACLPLLQQRIETATAALVADT
jgi:hypothetical protein